MSFFQMLPDEMLDHTIRAELSADPMGKSVEEKLDWIRRWVGIKAVLGTPDFTSLAFVRRLTQQGGAVARLWVRNRDEESTEAGYFGTGFLVGPDLLMTNNHVVRNGDDARNTVAWFGYEEDEEGREREPVEIPVRELVHHSPETEYDYALLRLDSRPADVCPNCSPLPLRHDAPRPRVNDPVFIIQHPQGGPKRVVLANNQVCRVYGARRYLIHYEADTDLGSSGAPVFDSSLRVVALHHAFAGGKNEGVLIQFILQDAGDWIP